jgi:hypothetical protein
MKKKMLLVCLLLVVSCIGIAEAQFSTPTIQTTRFQAVLTNSTATTLTEIQAAPGAGLSLYITDITMSASVIATTTTDQQLNLKSGTGTNCGTGTAVVFSVYNLAFSGPSVKLVTPIKLPAATALCFIHAASGNKSVVVGGYIAP